MKSTFKKIVTLFLASVMLIGSVPALSSCRILDMLRKEKEYLRVTVSVGAEVELMVGGDGDTVSATGLDVKGDLLVYGESLTEIAPDESAARLARLAKEFGFLGSDTPISYSVSGDSPAAEKLRESINEQITNTLGTMNIDTEPQLTDPLTHEELRDLAYLVTGKRGTALSGKTEGELNLLIAEMREETAHLPTADMRSAYATGKELARSLAEEIKREALFRSFGGVYYLDKSGYQNLIDDYEVAINSLNYDIMQALVSSSSDYCKARDQYYRALAISFNGGDTDAVAAAEEAMRTARRIANTTNNAFRLNVYSAENALEEVRFTYQTGSLSESMKSSESAIATAGEDAAEAFPASFEDSIDYDLSATREVFTAVKNEMRGNG